MASTKVDGGAAAVGKPVIVVAVDDSEYSFHALRWTLLRFFSSAAAGSTLPFKLVVVHARPAPTSIISLSATGAPDMLSVVKADLTKISLQVIAKAKEMCLAHSVRDVECEVLEGDARIVLCQAVEKHHAEILVMGSHGYGAIKRAVLGSVSDYCAHHADCNVMIVKMPKQDCLPMGKQFGMSTLPYVFSPQPLVMPLNESRRASVDASVCNKEPVTPSSILGTQWPSHSSHIEHEYEPVRDDSKRTVWSSDEDVILAKSWATISTDAVIDNDQKDQAFWKRITNYYNKHRPAGTVPRIWKRLKSHYYKFMPMVNEFSVIYNNFSTDRQSSWSNENVLENALNMWKAKNNNKDFKYMHVWRVLREYEKYAPQPVSHHSSKKARTSESRGHTSTSNLDMCVDVDDCEVCIRPIEQKAAKKKGKSKVRESDKMEQSINTNWQDIKGYQMQKLVLQEAEVLHKDYEILMKDTSEMTPGQLRLHEKIVEKINQRYDLARCRCV
ncbi:uncharacterized protein LOC122037365 [Zingiber officinale]|uniref:uncharacterized protein LOC122037365 n=1 Tax=Zingiber officinale TaxID=94328 RepID=UPI001C4AAF75|nr:uncharacterized protein LOC122037365 [Zingiber officinale]